MKLRDFNKKSSSFRPTQNKLVINNDAAETKYKAEIQELNSQLGRYRRMEAERDEAVSKFNSIEETLKSERFEADKNRELILGLEKDKSVLFKTTERIPALEEDLRAAKGLAGMKESELDEITKKAFEQSRDMSLLKSKLYSITIDHEKSSLEAKEAISIKQSTDADFEAISNKNEKIQSFATETSKINKELIEENKTLRDWANYKDIENKELAIQLEELKSVETKLREWMGKMENKDSQTTSSKTSLEKKVSTQQGIITDMSKTLDDMIKELAYLTKINSGYRSELAKPTYTSMSAIASQEGFVMPNGKENIRTKNLGNYKPTLLKFKKKEEVKNGN